MLPWRKGPNGPEVLLITTCTTKRWIVPKGWPAKGGSPQDCAAREALEEAGISGKIEAEPLGSFRYRKRRKSGAFIHVKVVIFAMEAMEQTPSWPEQYVRECLWCTLPDAVQRDSTKGLRRLILSFEAALGVPPG